jgi:LysR family transcriptional regulator, transcriptional activator of the cysJI operon
LDHSGVFSLSSHLSGDFEKHRLWGMPVMENSANLNPQSLIVFYHVAHEKNLTQAAEKLYLTQPGITYHIRLLEKHFSIKLLYIEKNRVVLTSAGEGVYKYAEKIYKHILDTEKFIRSLTDLSLNVGLEGPFIPVIAPIFSLFTKKYPEVRLIVKSKENLDLINDLLELKLDLAIVHQSQNEEDRLKYLFTDSSRKLVCFASTRIKLPPEPIGWDVLSQYPFVIGIEGSTIRKIIEDKFQEKGLPMPRFAAEVNSTEWHKKFVANGTGLSFILSEDIEREIAQGSLRIVSLKEEIFIPLKVVVRNDMVINHVITDFVSLLKKEIH